MSGLILHNSPGERLLAHGFDAGVCRPYIGNDGETSYVTINGKALPIQAMASLRKDEWKQLDDAIVRATRVRHTAVDTLNGRGMAYNINGMMKTVLESENQSDVTAAQLSMDGLTPAEKDRVNFELVGLPLPFASKDFHISARTLGASRATGQPLDTVNAESCTYKVKDKIEDMLLNGASSYKAGGYVLYGMTDFPNRNTYSLTANWDDSAATGAVVVEDALAMKQALIDDGFYGPYGIFIPTNFETALDADYSTVKGDGTVRERLLKIDGLEFVTVCDKLTADNVIMFQLSTDVVRMVNGMALATLQWETLGGMSLHYKVMTIQVPQIRADQSGNCGIVHAT